MFSVYVCAHQTWFCAWVVFERSCLHETGNGSNENGNRPFEKPLGASEQYIEHQKATIDLIQGGSTVTLAW